MSRQRAQRDGWKEVLDPVVARYRGKVSRIYFRADGVKDTGRGAGMGRFGFEAVTRLKSFHLRLEY